MGTLYLRGNKPMSDLLICHVSDETTHEDFRFFLRLLHRSTIISTTDVVFIFSSPSSSSSFSHIIHQENHSFMTLLHSQNNNTFFNTSRFLHKGNNHPVSEPLWGNKLRNNTTTIATTTTSLSYGSILSFDATELDPENSLSGFLDRVPFSLRRWACYPMLLGRVRRNFKHVMLVDTKTILILRDPFNRVKNRSPESVLLFNKHGKKLQSSTQRTVLPAVVIGGARGVRRLSNAVMVEIVRAATQHRKKKNSVTESVLLSQLASNEFLLKSKNVQLNVLNELIPEVSSLNGHNHAIIQRDMNNHDLNSVIKKQICSSVVDSSSVYRDC